VGPGLRPLRPRTDEKNQSAIAIRPDGKRTRTGVEQAESDDRETYALPTVRSELKPLGNGRWFLDRRLRGCACPLLCDHPRAIRPEQPKPCWISRPARSSPSSPGFSRNAKPYFQFYPNETKPRTPPEQGAS